MWVHYAPAFTWNKYLRLSTCFIVQTDVRSLIKEGAIYIYSGFEIANQKEY